MLAVKMLTILDITYSTDHSNPCSVGTNCKCWVDVYVTYKEILSIIDNRIELPLFHFLNFRMPHVHEADKSHGDTARLPSGARISCPTWWMGRRSPVTLAIPPVPRCGTPGAELWDMPRSLFDDMVTVSRAGGRGDNGNQCAFERVSQVSPNDRRAVTNDLGVDIG